MFERFTDRARRVIVLARHREKRWKNRDTREFHMFTPDA